MHASRTQAKQQIPPFSSFPAPGIHRFLIVHFLKMHSLRENVRFTGLQRWENKTTVFILLLSFFFFHGWVIPWSNEISWKRGFWPWLGDGVGVSAKNRRGFWRIWREEVRRGQETRDSTVEHGQRREKERARERDFTKKTTSWRALLKGRKIKRWG